MDDPDNARVKVPLSIDNSFGNVKVDIQPLIDNPSSNFKIEVPHSVDNLSKNVKGKVPPSVDNPSDNVKSKVPPQVDNPSIDYFTRIVVGLGSRWRKKVRTYSCYWKSKDFFTTLVMKIIIHSTVCSK